MILISESIASLSLPVTLGGFSIVQMIGLVSSLHAVQSDYNSVAYHNNSGRIGK